jgi:hypothetical protein
MFAYVYTACVRMLYYSNNSAVDDVQVRLSVIGSFMSRVEQHMLKHSNQLAVADGTTSTASVTTLTKRSIKSLKSSSSKGIFSIDSLTDLQPLDDVEAAVLQSIVDDSRDTDSTVTMNESDQSSTNTMSADSLNNSGMGSSAIGYGRALDSTALTALPTALANLQVNPSDITKVHEHYIGRGGFAKVYKVNYNDHGTNRICAAKVCNHVDIC